MRLHYLKKSYNGWTILNIGKCGWCGRLFLKKYSQNRYCHQKCRKYAQNEQKNKYMRLKYKKKNNKWIGTGYLSNHARDNKNKEVELIKKEKKRLRL